MKKIILLIFITIIISHTIEAQYSITISSPFQNSNPKNNILCNIAQSKGDIQFRLPINIQCNSYNGKIIVKTSDFRNCYEEIIIDSLNRKFLEDIDYEIFLYKLLIGDTLLISDTVFNQLIEHYCIKKVSLPKSLINYPNDQKQKFLESILVNNKYLKNKNSTSNGYSEDEIITLLFDWGYYFVYDPDNAQYVVRNLKEIIYYNNSNDLNNIVNNCLLNFIDSINTNKIQKIIFVSENKFYPGFYLNKCELIKRGIKTIDKDFVDDYINTFGNNLLIIDLNTINLFGNEMKLNFVLMNFEETPYRKGYYRKMIFDDEDYIFKLNEENQWVKK